MSPIISTFGAASNQGFINTPSAGSTGAGTANEIYVSRGDYGNNTTTLTTLPTMGSNWGHAGNNCDAINFYVDGNGSYTFNSFFMGSPTGSTGTYNQTFYFQITTGTSTGGVVVYSETFNYNFNNTGNVTQYRLTTPPTLTRGTSYVVAYGFASGAGLTHTSYALLSADIVNNNPTISPPGAGGSATVYFSNASFGGSSPWNLSNGTSTAAGQFPMISISI